MKDRVNFYFAMLVMAIFGAGAALIIVHVANNNQYNVLNINPPATTTPELPNTGTEASYGPLQQSILNH